MRRSRALGLILFGILCLVAAGSAQADPGCMLLCLSDRGNCEQTVFQDYQECLLIAPTFVCDGARTMGFRMCDSQYSSCTSACSSPSNPPSGPTPPPPPFTPACFDGCLYGYLDCLDEGNPEPFCAAARDDCIIGCGGTI